LQQAQPMRLLGGVRPCVCPLPLRMGGNKAEAPRY